MGFYMIPKVVYRLTCPTCGYAYESSSIKRDLKKKKWGEPCKNLP